MHLLSYWGLVTCVHSEYRYPITASGAFIPDLLCDPENTAGGGRLAVPISTRGRLVLRGGGSSSTESTSYTDTACSPPAERCEDDRFWINGNSLSEPDSRWEDGETLSESAGLAALFRDVLVELLLLDCEEKG